MKDPIKRNEFSKYIFIGFRHIMSKSHSDNNSALETKR
jgi:hypothetical protein